MRRFMHVPLGGIPRDIWFWKDQEKIIMEFAKAESLIADPGVEEYGRHQEGVEFKSGASPAFIDWTISGGNRGPHLHFKDKVYLLNAKQWKAFSEKVVRDFQSRLEGANAIPLENLIELDEAISGLSMKG